MYRVIKFYGCALKFKLNASLIPAGFKSYVDFASDSIHVFPRDRNCGGPHQAIARRI